MILPTDQVLPPLRPTAARVLPHNIATMLNMLSVQPSAQLTAIHDFLSDPNIASWAAETIRHVLADPAHLAEIAQQAFAHPNGFDSIPLENRHPHYRVRLHVWWPEDTLITESAF